MKHFLQKKLFIIILLLLLINTACSNKTEDLPTVSQNTSNQTALEINYCNIDASNLCLEGFGREGEDKLIILFKADNPSFTNIYVSVEKNNNEVAFECISIEEFETNIYCTGGVFPNRENIQVNVYSKENDEFIAKGEFTLQYGVIQIPNNAEFETLIAPTPSSSSKNPTAQSPSYPNYPNSSYENPTETP